MRVHLLWTWRDAVVLRLICPNFRAKQQPGPAPHRSREHTTPRQHVAAQSSSPAVAVRLLLLLLLLVWMLFCGGCYFGCGFAVGVGVVDVALNNFK